LQSSDVAALLAQRGYRADVDMVERF